MDRKPLRRLLYWSTISIPGPAAQVDAEVGRIVARAERKNAERGITGALMCGGGIFVQVLEGRPDAIEGTFEAICCDLRHRALRLIEFVQADERAFPDWSLARVPTLAEAPPPLRLAAADLARPAAQDPDTIIRIMRRMMLADA